jgi:hypothetical protein
LSFEERREDVGDDTVDVGVDVGVRDAEGVEAFSPQHGIANAVVFGLVFIEVAAAIGFDDETRLEADEIEEISPERRLPPEPKPLRSQRLEVRPKPRFLRRKRASHRPGAISDIPPPKWGGRLATAVASGVGGYPTVGDYRP